MSNGKMAVLKFALAKAQNPRWAFPQHGVPLTNGDNVSVEICRGGLKMDSGLSDKTDHKAARQDG
jgi:hypothetical protein